jgi:hypothetical protein
VAAVVGKLGLAVALLGIFAATFGAALDDGSGGHGEVVFPDPRARVRPRCRRADTRCPATFAYGHGASAAGPAPAAAYSLQANEFV